MRELTVEASVENLQTVLDFVDELLEEIGCPMKARMQLDIAVEEIFVNIASYAYQPGTGQATIQLELQEGSKAVTVTFLDRGIPYDPTKKEDPDVALPAEERQIGGLGIYMVKKSMDEVRYSCRDGQNILRIRKLL